MGAMRDEVARRALVQLEPHADALLKSSPPYASFFDGCDGDDGAEIATRIFFYNRSLLLACLEDMLEGLADLGLAADKREVLVDVVMRLVVSCSDPSSRY